MAAVPSLGRLAIPLRSPLGPPYLGGMLAALRALWSFVAHGVNALKQGPRTKGLMAGVQETGQVARLDRTREKRLLGPMGRTRRIWGSSRQSYGPLESTVKPPGAARTAPIRTGRFRSGKGLKL